MVKIENWKLVAEDEVKNYVDHLITVFDPHYDNEVEVLAIVSENNGCKNLCAYDFKSRNVYPLIEKEGRLEVLNSIIVGFKGEGPLQVSKNLLKPEDEFKFIRYARG